MAQIGRGELPLDASNQKEVDHFKAKVDEYMSKMGEDMKKNVVSAGYPIIHAL